MNTILDYAEAELAICEVCEQYDLSPSCVTNLCDLLDCRHNGRSITKIDCELAITCTDFDIGDAAATKLRAIIV